MAFLARLNAIADELNIEFYERTRDAEAARAAETAAVTKIQAVARGFLVRLHLRNITAIVLKIQRHWRAWLGRRRFEVALDTRLKEKRREYFDAQATVIQRWWRGHFSRKYIHSFYARKEFLAAVKRKNLETQAWLQEEYSHSVAVAKQTAMAEARATFESKITNLHHLVSTASQPGIFNSPFNVVTGTVPTVGGVPVEDHLRAATMNTIKLPPVKLDPKLHTTGSTRRKTSRTRLTINAASNYEALREAKNMDHVLDKGEVLAHHPNDFKNIVRHVEPYLGIQSRRNMERYHTPYDPTIGIRTERVDAEMAAISPGETLADNRFKKYWRKQDVFDDTI